MKKKMLIHKGFTLLMTGALVLTSVPISAETVSENEAEIVLEEPQEEILARDETDLAAEGETESVTDTEMEDSEAEVADEAEVDTATQTAGEFSYTENEDGTITITKYNNYDAKEIIFRQNWMERRL